MADAFDELIKDGYKSIRFSQMGKVRRFLYIWHNGRKDRFPICCIIRFALESAYDDGKTYPLLAYKAKNRGAARGSAVTKTSKATFIPCNIFHHKNVDN